MYKKGNCLQMTQSAYIHIPFCKSKCAYCSFVSYPNYDESCRHEYVKTLLKEIKYFYKNEPLNTLYLGGGTPSLIDVSDLMQIVQNFAFMSNPEITIETNPETVDLEKLKEIHTAGFNRISIGIQSFDDRILKSIGRIHNSQKAVETIEESFKAGFENVSVDFIYGLPGQTLESFCDDLKRAVKLGVTHVSLYGLKIEKGCDFYKKPPENIADDDLQADMYLAAIDTLENCGFLHYEISNFAKSAGFESRHNLNYWQDFSYYGFGAGAHGYDAFFKTRYENFSNLKEYTADYTGKAKIIELSESQMLEETIFLGFRCVSGLAVKSINDRFGIDFDNKYEEILSKYLESGHIVKTKTGYRLSNEGFLLSNIILADFLC